MRTFASRIKGVGLGNSCASCSLSGTRRATMHYPSPTATRGVRTLVTRIGSGKSAVNNVVAYMTRKIPVNLNRPMFKGLRTTLKRTVLAVGTMGNFRCNSNFRTTLCHNSRQGSHFFGSGKRVGAHAGRSNNVRKNVSGKRSVCFHITFGSITAVLVRRRAIGARNRSAVLGTHKHRSPYILPQTIPVIRSVATVALLSFLLVRGVQG